jgi:parallel beta-helix repeat protein
MRIVLARVWLAALIAVCAGLLSAGSAPANHVSCGDVITQDTKLDSDVVCTGGTQDPLIGVAIGADGVRFDLDGFSILGPNRGEQVEDVQAGISTSGALRGVTIEDGTIQGFSEGMLLYVSESVIRDVTSLGRVTVRGNGNVVRDSSVSDGDTGLAVRGDDNRILRNSAGGFDGAGIDVRGARSRVIGNVARSFIAEAIRISDFTDVMLRDNVASSAVGDGIALVEGRGGVAERNVANDNDSAAGIVVLADDLLIRKNEASRNDVNGISIFGTGNTVKQNVANENNGYGIYAVPGNFDGGGNRAGGNGAAAQCVGVRCR